MSSSQHTKIEFPQAMQDNSCSSKHHILFSTNEANFLLELLGEQETNGTNVQDDSMKVASSSKHEIEDNPFEARVATERNRTRNNLANVALLDSNPFERGDAELACIRRSIQKHYLGYESEMTSLQINNFVYPSNISSFTPESDERNASNEKTLVIHRGMFCKEVVFT
ncbi:hypothetical protein TSUD_182660 [Trifolium subterraneum]|uniref:Uncharacterized protein n=1 Tax=Trifolium subterraneum TaxID=3900 RepID=A0A2Z6LGQ1_TRISU|nr:hypothetical protein TSUD_182660 [Trifolium subterraneum]